MGRCLIVANQTLGGDLLDRAVRERIDRGDDFFVVVPTTAPEHETAAWALGFPVDGGMLAYASSEVFEEDERRRHAAEIEARQRAERRLDQMIEKVRSSGGDADGRVGDADPTVAVQQALDAGPVDEILVSTLPAGLSRWLRMDLPSRIERMTDLPVTTIEAEPDPSDDAQN
jgi:hypothetical protein